MNIHYCLNYKSTSVGVVLTGKTMIICVVEVMFEWYGYCSNTNNWMYICCPAE